MRLALLGILVMPGCGLADVFASPRVADISFVFVGDTTLRVGDRRPITIVVIADGSELSNARFRTALNQNTAVALTPTGDSLVGLSAGRGELHVWLVSSMLPEAAPSFIQGIKVQGGGGGAPAR
jgi:hypothetical protein